MEIIFDSFDLYYILFLSIITIFYHSLTKKKVADLLNHFLSTVSIVYENVEDLMGK